LLSDKFLGGYLRDAQLGQIAEYAISECGDLGRVQQFIREKFLPLLPTEGHKLIPKFVWHGLATTNYDQLIEDGYAQTKDRQQEPRPMIEDRDRIDENLRDPRNVLLLKLHGCITRITSERCPLILTPDQYLEHRSGRSRLFRTLMEWGAEHPLVFVGHSVSDSDIRAVLLELRELGEYRPRYFIVAPDADEIKKRFWETKKITLLNGTIEEFLRTLDAQIPASFRALATIGAPAGRHLIEQHSRTGTPLSSSTVQFLKIDVEYVNGISATAHMDPKDFYKGKTGGFAALEQGLDVRRRISDDLTSEYLIRATTYLTHKADGWQNATHASYLGGRRIWGYSFDSGDGKEQEAIALGCS